MPVQKTDRDTTWQVDQANKTWTLSKNATITVDGQFGIYESVSGSTIKVNGDIVASGATAAIRFQGSDSSVAIGADSFIDARQADFGISAAGAGSDIVNRGRILADGDGIYGDIWADMQNYGTINGDDYGMRFLGAGSQIYNYGKILSDGTGIATDAAGSYLENGKDGLIRGDDIGVLVRDTGDMELRNKGTIRSDGFAIESENNELSVINTGKIVGDVALGGGDDVFSTRNGKFDGFAHGGDGDDTFFTDRSNVDFREDLGGGDKDQVVSTASFKLGANIEYLVLNGKKDIDGTGNAGDNKLSGNAGDNVMSGKGGLDFLTGNAGDDDLFGGGGLDVFFFATGGDIDRVKDFQDGTDLIGIDGVSDFGDFAALDIKQTKGGDVVIDLGGGDKLIIEDTLKTDITFDDIYLI